MIQSKWIILLSLSFHCVKIFAQDIDTIQQNKKNDSVHINHIINIIPDRHNGVVDGLFMNIARGSHKGFHVALVNWNQKNFKGLQLATVNITGGNAEGAQVAFLNHCFDTLKGSQVGLVNVSNVNNGLQIGAINYSDTIRDGSAWAVLTFVRRGGYYATEYYVSEMFPINFSLKAGLSDRHSTLSFSTDGKFNTMFVGGGLGFFRQLNNRFFFNPEFAYQSAIGNNQGLLSACTKFCFELNTRIYISAGPSFIWNHSKTGELNVPYIALVDETSVNGKNQFVIGLRFGIRYNITKLAKIRQDKAI